MDQNLMGQSKDHDGNNGEFEYVIRYEDGIRSDFVLASSSVPVNYEYTKLNIEDHKSAYNIQNRQANK